MRAGCGAAESGGIGYPAWWYAAAIAAATAVAGGDSAEAHGPGAAPAEGCSVWYRRGD